MDETQDPKPHPHVVSGPQRAAEGAPGSIEQRRKPGLSIWFFCGILMLAYGLAQGVYEHFGHQPNTVLANLQPTLWWGVALTLFGGFYTVRFRPGKG
jgi:hypothetical protein